MTGLATSYSLAMRWLYLACIGVAFIALGGGLLIRSDTVTSGQVILWCLAAVAFLAGLALAACDVRRQMAAIQEQRRGLEGEMEFMLLVFKLF